MHQGRDAVQARLLKFKTGLQGFEGHPVADMAEGRLIEIKTQGIGWTVYWAVEPEDLGLGVDEAPNQPGTSQAVYPRTLTRRPGTTLIVGKAEYR